MEPVYLLGAFGAAIFFEIVRKQPRAAELMRNLSWAAVVVLGIVIAAPAVLRVLGSGTGPGPGVPTYSPPPGVTNETVIPPGGLDPPTPIGNIGGGGLGL